MSMKVTLEEDSLQTNTNMADTLWLPPVLDLFVNCYTAQKAKWIDCNVTELEKTAPEYQSANFCTHI